MRLRVRCVWFGQQSVSIGRGWIRCGTLGDDQSPFDGLASCNETLKDGNEPDQVAAVTDLFLVDGLLEERACLAMSRDLRVAADIVERGMGGSLLRRLCDGARAVRIWETALNSGAAAPTYKRENKKEQQNHQLWSVVPILIMGREEYGHQAGRPQGTTCVW